MNSLAKLGVVTVTYNSSQVLRGFLRSIEKQTYGNFILYAVDSASKDTTIEQLDAWHDPRLRIVSNNVNVGIAEGNNQGARNAIADGCDYVLFLNNDIEFEPETFAVLLSEIEALRCDLLGPKIWSADGVHIWSAGGGFNRLKGYLGFHIGEGEVDCGQFEVPKRVEHTPACCLLVRVSVFRKIGMMDPKYFVYWDDGDFSFRALRAGLLMFYTPHARILHKVSSLTGGPKSDFTVRYNVRGHVYFMLKNLGLLKSLYYLPAWELRLLYKLFTHSLSRHEFMTRQSAFFEGFTVWASK